MPCRVSLSGWSRSAGLLSSFVPFVSSLPRAIYGGPAAAPSLSLASRPYQKGATASRWSAMMSTCEDLHGVCGYHSLEWIPVGPGGQVITGELISHRSRIEPDSARSRLYRSALGSYFLVALFALAAAFSAFAAG
jgi:hypothetical protein